MLRSSPPPVRRTPARALFIVLVVAALIAATVAGVRPLFTAGRTPEARWARVEREVRAHLTTAFSATQRIAADLARRPGVVNGLGSGDEGPQALFREIELYVRHPAPSLAVTILDTSGAARAWHGRPSELGGLASSAPAGSAVTASALGFRIVRFEPIVDPASSRRLGTSVVEQVMSRARVGSLVSEAFRLSTEAGDVTLRRVGAAVPANETLRVIVEGPGREPLIVASADPRDLEDAIDADARRAWAAFLAIAAALLVLATGPLVDFLALAATTRRALFFAGCVAALLAAARLLLWIALPRLPIPIAPPLDAGASLSALFLRSPVDLCLTGGLLLGFAAVLASIAGRARAGLRHLRRWPAAARAAFGTQQIVAAAIAAALLAACEFLIARSVARSGVESLSLSLHPWAAEQWEALFGIILLQTAAVWLAASVLTLALVPWRVARRSSDALVPLALWFLSAVLVAVFAQRLGVSLSWSFALSLVLAACAGLFAARVTSRYRRAGPSARLLAFGLAFLVPALIAYPALVEASEARTRSLVEARYSRDTLRHRDELRETLEAAARQIDAIPNLRALATADDIPGGTERAFVVWSQTALAERRLSSSVELYAADGRLVSRFALNFPEYEAAAQITRSETCAWRLFGEARPFGAEERAALHAERAICSRDGRRSGSIVVHVMLDYNALPFISPESPYREVFSPGGASREPGHPRQLALVIYGWSLLPVYTSGVQVWPIDEALFERLYRSRAGFWATLPARDERWHVYFVNDRSGIYALGFPAFTAFDHLVHLAELAMLAAGFYLLGLAAMAVFNRVARGGAWTRRALLRDIRASFYRKLLIAFVAASVVPVLALALVIRTYFATRLRADVNAEAARTATIAQHALEELAALLRLAGLSAPPINDDLMVEVSQMIGRDVNVFEGATLLATSQRDLYASGLLPTRTPEDVYRELILQRRPTYVGEDNAGDLPYLIAAAPVSSPGRDAIVTVPLASRQQEIEREIEELDRGLLLAVVLFIIVGAAIGLPTAERIADPVRRLTRASRRIAAGDFDTRVAIRSIDELRRLVDAFNQMAAELKTQQQQLERTHRLEAWAEMARQVAHEIKNPLTPIQLSAEHLRRVHGDRGQPLSPVLEGCVDSILQQVRLLRQIAGEFSSFASSPTARPAPTDVNALLDEVVTPYRSGLEGRIDVRLDIPANLPQVIADKVLVSRAITNIIENALHAMPGRGTLEITAREEGAFVAIAVRDTGAGMDEEALARVFEPYFSTKATGTGLGLTIASRNVELSGGTIGVASKKGVGTTVTIRLRVAGA